MLLSDRAFQTIPLVKQCAHRRRDGKGAVIETPFLFPQSKKAEYMNQTSDLQTAVTPMRRYA